MGKIKNWKLENLPDAVSSSICLNDVLRYLDIPLAGGNYHTVRKWINKLNLNTSHFDPSRAISNNLKIRNTIKYSVETVFVVNCQFSKGVVRRLARQILQYICGECGNTGFHNGQELVLQLDHKNGINNDNRLENLRWLCPNCHSQTKTFAGRNIINAKGSIKRSVG